MDCTTKAIACQTEAPTDFYGLSPNACRHVECSNDRHSLNLDLSCNEDEMVTPRDDLIQENCMSRRRTFSEQLVEQGAVRAIINYYNTIVMPVKKDVPGYPRILLVSRQWTRKAKFINFIGEYHLDLIQRFGGAPVIVPRTRHTLECLEMYMPMDGFMVTEGEDISPEFEPYEHSDIDPDIKNKVCEAHGQDSLYDPSKDRIEWELLCRCKKLNIPFLGICRGAQMVNVLNGGSLYFDVESELSGTIAHISYDNYDTHRHKITVLPKTPMAQWFHEEGCNKQEGSGDNVLPQSSFSISVNSYHHQGVNRLADNFVPMAHSEDGLVEGFYDPSLFNPAEGKFCVGLQFHPERMSEEYPGCVRVYGDFIEACWTHRRHRLRARVLHNP
eukprot:GHVQ01015853.1.p1 GENE.GHVQ01015853.1~~GHVQ01015853.1.p1  ORF type:complete len:386 (+),score=32.04 GHVQ01015853.1:475-1632(+)